MDNLIRTNLKWHILCVLNLQGGAYTIHNVTSKQQKIEVWDRAEFYQRIHNIIADTCILQWFLFQIIIQINLALLNKIESTIGVLFPLHALQCITLWGMWPFGFSHHWVCIQAETTLRWAQMIGRISHIKYSTLHVQCTMKGVCALIIYLKYA